mmetsp:Transcript_16981/g.45775  ORF Transcript_16981/g.45775 Transcript_16981/m.45775 type:complete len:284 (-) Transcript_16981:527-1378(-)
MAPRTRRARLLSAWCMPCAGTWRRASATPNSWQSRARLRAQTFLPHPSNPGRAPSSGLRLVPCSAPPRTATSPKASDRSPSSRQWASSRPRCCAFPSNSATRACSTRWSSTWRPSVRVGRRATCSSLTSPSLGGAISTVGSSRRRCSSWACSSRTRRRWCTRWPSSTRREFSPSPGTPSCHSPTSTSSPRSPSPGGPTQSSCSTWSGQRACPKTSGARTRRPTPRQAPSAGAPWRTWRGPPSPSPPGRPSATSWRWRPRQQRRARRRWSHTRWPWSSLLSPQR